MGEYNGCSDMGIMLEDGKIRRSSSDNVRYYPLGVSKLNPGQSGAVWISPSSTTLGGWQVDAATEIFYFMTDIHADWDGASNMVLEIFFEKNTVGGSAGDSVDLKLQTFYKGLGESACKTQTIAENAVVVGNASKGTLFKATFEIDYDVVNNIVESGDKFSFMLNLETDSSECQDIILTNAEYYYPTTHVSIEEGDV